MNAGKYILSFGLLLLSFNTLSAQHKDGLEISYLPNIAYLSPNFAGNAVFLPQFGYYHQNWVEDRYCKYQSVTYQQLNIENYSGPRLSGRTRVRLLNFTWGRLKYLNHAEFDDDQAWFFTYGMGVGIGSLLIEDYDVNLEVEESQTIPFGQYTLLKFGWGYERKINRNFQLNASAELAISTMPNLSLNVRLMRNRY